MDEIQDFTTQHIKGAIEALLFVADKPLTLESIKDSLQTVDPESIKAAIELLRNEYLERGAGVAIEEIAGGFQILTQPAYATYIRNFFKTRHKEKLSKPSLETMAIVAYKQPVTRADVEAIRGVNSDGVFTHLMDKELIKIVGRKDVPGKPYIYGTTKYFLEYFGLKSLKSLPKLEEFPDLQAPDIDQEIEVDPEVAREVEANPDLLPEVPASSVTAPEASAAGPVLPDVTVSQLAERVIREEIQKDGQS